MRNQPKSLVQVCLLALLTCVYAAAANSAHAAKFKVLHSFCEDGGICADGNGPLGPLLMDSAGNIFGTTSTGGHGAGKRRGEGTVFELERRDDGSLKFRSIFTFLRHDHAQAGADPYALIIDAQGNLYGTSASGGNGYGGVVFELSPAGESEPWTEKVLYTFCSQENCSDGSDPEGLTYAGASSGESYDGTSPLYGATYSGGANSGGAVFELTQNGGQWEQNVLYNFCSQGGSDCTDGKFPYGNVILDNTGNLFGGTASGGTTNVTGGGGVIFELTVGGGKWTQAVLYRFCSRAGCSDGYSPSGVLIQDTQGNLFGTTSFGGQSCSIHFAGDGCGTIFELVPNGHASKESVLYRFCARQDCADGANPVAGVFLDSSGNLFGTAQFGGGNDIDGNGFGGGVVYELVGKSLKVLHRFCSLLNCADGEYPPTGGLASSSTGELYGTTFLGGAFGGGTVFELKP